MAIENVLERRPWLLPLILAVLTVLFLRPLLIPPASGQALDSHDLVGYFYPLQDFNRMLIQSGELPLWNPHQFIGTPIAGNPQMALFYPATWLMWLIGAERGLNISLVFHVWLAAWGMAQLARSFGSSRVAGLFAGIIYGMSGFIGARFYAGHYTLVVVFAWIPWVMAAYRHALTRGTWRSVLPGIAALGLAVLAGHPPLLVFLAICLATLWFYHVASADRPVAAGWYALRLLIVIGVGGAILGAALLLPTAELTALSSRAGGTDLEFANQYALPPAQLISLALPYFFGNPTVSPNYYWGQPFYDEFSAYAGLLALLAIPLAIRLRRGWYFAGLVALGLMLAVGVDGALLPILIRWVPGFSFFRSPGRSLFFVLLGMSGLTALVVTALQSATADERREWLRPAVRVWLPAAAGIAFTGAVIFSGWYGSSDPTKPMPLRSFQISGSLAEAGVILAGVWFVLWLWTDANPKSAQKSAQWALLLTGALITLDAWHAAIPVITVDAINPPYWWAGAPSHIPTGPDARVLAPPTFETEASVTGHLNVDGYDPLEIDTYAKLQTDAVKGDPLNPTETLLGVKYYITATPDQKSNLKLIGIGDGGAIYYQRTDLFPRAWIAKTVSVEPNDDATRQHITSGKENMQDTVYTDHAVACSGSSGGTATISEYRPNDVTIQTSSADGGLMTLSDQFYPGWKATVDGQPADIIRADTVFRAVCVPAGEHTVKFEYRPLSLLIGVVVSAAGWIVIAALALVAWRRRKARAW